MRPGEILVARLSGGATFVRFEEEERKGRVVVLLGKNRFGAHSPQPDCA